MSDEQKKPESFDEHTLRVRAYAKERGITNAAAAREIYVAENRAKWESEEKATEPK